MDVEWNPHIINEINNETKFFEEALIKINFKWIGTSYRKEKDSPDEITWYLGKIEKNRKK